jgi:hypothetical protein
MSIQEVSPEQLAELFHHYHQALASDFDCEGSPNSEAWDRVGKRKRSAWWLRRDWHSWSYPRQTQNATILGASLRHRVKPNGVVDRLHRHS